MPSLTRDGAEALAYVRNGYPTARWNFSLAAGTRVEDPGGLGQGVEVSYSFWSAPPPYEGAVSGFAPLPEPARMAVRAILGQIEALTALRFREVSDVGSITFGMRSMSFDEAGYAYVPGFGYSYRNDGTIVTVEESRLGGDVWISRSPHWSAQDWQPGRQGYATFLHEIGHALGLKHPFEASADGFVLQPSLDNMRHTVMSYTPASDVTVIHEVRGGPTRYEWSYGPLPPQSYMPLDVAALQYLYGSNAATRVGNDRYAWETSPVLLRTVWDGGGEDTFDAANQVLPNVIDLTPGRFSSIGLRLDEAALRTGLPSWFTAPLPQGIYTGRDNVAIANGAWIEHVVGGTAMDVLAGNARENRLSGGDGDDRLFGLTGADVLDGAPGNDQLFGGAGSDWLVGGPGRDFLTGGLGADAFVFDTLGEGSAAADVGGGSAVWDGGSAAGNGTAGMTGSSAAGSADVVLDFTPGEDQLVFARAVFSALQESGAGGTGGAGGAAWLVSPDGLALRPLDPALFSFGASAPAPAVRLWYDAASGWLRYDVDGLGPQPAVAVAKLLGAPSLQASDVWVV